MNKHLNMLFFWFLLFFAASTSSADEALDVQQASSSGLMPLLLIGTFIFYRYKTRDKRAAKKAEKKRIEQWSAEDKLPEVVSSMRVISESIELFRNSKNMETATSRYNLTLERLESLLHRFPHRTDWRSLYSAIVIEGSAKFQNSLETIINKHIERSSLAKSASAKQTPLRKALMEISNAEDSGIYSDEWLVEKREYILSLMHSSELDELLEKAERYEFKGEAKKALGAFQDALFFIKRDDILDDEQTELIDMIEAKIEKFKNG